MQHTTRLLRATALAALTGLAPGCELATHFGDYSHNATADTGAGGLDGGDGGGRDAGDAGDGGGRDSMIADGGNADLGTMIADAGDAGSNDAAMVDGGPTSHHVMVTIAGAGGGMVDAMGGALVCTTGTCDWSVNDGTTLTIHASPNATSTLGSWGGACSTTTVPGDCSLHVTGDMMVTATFDVRHVVLTVVVSNPPGSVAVTQGAAAVLSCDGTSTPCMGTLNAGAMVTLTATPSAPNTEVAWAGAMCSGLTCTTTLNADTMITATFADARPVLSVTETGHGTVSTPDMLVNCANGMGNCSNIYPVGTTVTLTETPEAGYSFSGWTGCDSMTATTCTITLAAHQHATVTANFTINHYVMTVHMGGTAGGTVTSSSPMLTCTSAQGMCSASNIAYGATVTLTAVPDSGSVFQGWSGVPACATSGTTCTFMMTSDVDVTASFVPDTRTIHVVVSGADGQITSTTAPFNCTYTAGAATGTCMATLNVGATFDLSVLVHTGYHVSSWSSTPFSIGCTGSATTCNGTVVPAIPMSGGTITVNLAPTLYTLDVTATAATGGGTVQESVSASLVGTCAASMSGTDCPMSFAYGTMVTLHAVPNGGSVFLGWSGGVCNGTSDCVVTVDAAKSVTGTFAIQSTLLQVNTSGASTGTVQSTMPVGAINCGANCSAMLPVGTMVTLTATPAMNYTFTGWSGTICMGTGPCSFTMTNGSNIVTATFALIQETLTVANNGGGNCSGTVTDTGGGPINCGTACSGMYGYGTTVSLSQAPMSGCVFNGWSGCDSMTGGICQVAMTGARSVTANYAIASAPLQVRLFGSGGGNVSAGTAINCNSPSMAGDTCNNGFSIGLMLALTATPAPHTHVSWTGCTTVAGNQCNVTIAAGGNTVTATFDLDTYPVSAVIGGTATAGSIRSGESPSDISCPGTCNYNYAWGSNVTLTATANAPYIFTGWSGVPGCTTSPTCAFTVSGTVTATANFVSPGTIIVNLPASTAVGSRVFLPGGVTCTQGSTASNCSASVAPGAYSLGTAGNPLFVGPIWSGVSGCSGPMCTVNVTSGATTNVTVTWAQMGNLFFTTAANFNLPLAGTASAVPSAADADCQMAASNAGLPAPAGSWHAWISTTAAGGNIASRIPGADNIWIRVDGRPIATTRSQLLSGNLINPPYLDERGNPPTTGNAVWTGSTAAGMVMTPNCSDLPSNTATFGYTGLQGLTDSTWSANGNSGCGSGNRLYCLQTGQSGFAVLAPPPLPPTPVRIFVSSHTSAGGLGVLAMDNHCAMDASLAGLPGTYVAFVSTPSQSAYSRATMFGTITRTDGYVIGPHTSTMSVFNGMQPFSGYNLNASGTPVLGNAWTGMTMSSGPMGTGSACGTWNDSSMNGNAGNVDSVVNYAWSSTFISMPCSTILPWYCIQVGP